MAEEKRRSPLKVAAVVAMYWSISISMVFIMKHLLSGSYGNQDLTIFVTWYQSASVVVLILAMSSASRLLKFGLSIPSLDKETILNSDMLSLSFSFVISLTMNNLMLKHISVSFYQVARSLTLIFSILLSFCMLAKAPSYKVVLACLLIIAGFVIGVDQEEASGSITIWGIIYGLLASLTSALTGIYFKKGEYAVGGSALKLAYINNFNSMMIIFPLVLSTNQLSHIMNSDIATNPQLWLFLTASGALSLAIGWASALQIRYTSPVTHQISINAKSITQTVIAILWNNELKTVFWWFGNVLVLFGIGIYTFAKYQESKTQKVETSPMPTKNNSSSSSSPEKPTV
ncbi:GDP-fucose transporter 1-like [Haliotis rufescens]|uniref:GDP-fucose transporter 1-like n=1 Tax=Haliotis rufescens TaxID=6454 RepID=UPI001EB00CA0|nr:GDP-fucose transporter 1-like [Haliotis rufescens]